MRFRFRIGRMRAGRHGRGHYFKWSHLPLGWGDGLRDGEDGLRDGGDGFRDGGTPSETGGTASETRGAASEMAQRSCRCVHTHTGVQYNIVQVTRVTFFFFHC